jgi:hypothetical protein
MSDTVGSLSSSGKPSGKVRFSSYNLPALEDGLYEVTVSQKFQASDASTAASIPSRKHYFAALGPRFTLDPSEISTRFPAPGTIGRYYDILPHMLFTRAILPWERRCDPDKKHCPWLALLMVTKSEIDGWRNATGLPHLLSPRTSALDTAVADAVAKNIVFPSSISATPVAGAITLDPGESASLVFRYADFPETLLQQILPTEEELTTLCSVRQSADDTGTALQNPKFPSLLCNRLPQPGEENIMFLVSLDNRTDVYTQLAEAPALTGAPAYTADPQLYRLTVLDSWQFASAEFNLSFEQLLTGANNYTAGTQGAFCLPPIGHETADKILAKGYVPLEHQTRQGNRLISWYRGPFVPGVSPAAPAASLSQTPDALLRFFADVGMFDVSHAAAWSLGRSLMLSDKRTSLALFQWKRASAHAAKSLVPLHLPGASVRKQPPLPDVVADWFKRLSRLEQVPFNALVPDPALAPPESIQFFSVDSEWVQQLFCGAFAVGDILSGEETIESDLFAQLPIPAALSGFLLRSKVVAGWPHMQVAGYASVPTGANPPFMAGGTPLPLHRYTLGPDTLLCLFEGAIQSVELFERPETIHFGVDYKDEGVSPCFLKRLRDSNGDLQPFPTGQCGADRSTTYMVNEWVRIPFRPYSPGVVSISSLAALLGQALAAASTTPAEFAYQMVDSVPKVRFTFS